MSPDLQHLLGCETFIKRALSHQATSSLAIGAMRLLSFLLSAFALHGVADASAVKERRSTSSGTSTTILTPEFKETVQEIVNKGGIQGLTVALVSKTGPAELGAWGTRSENGTNMTTDVR